MKVKYNPIRFFNNLKLGQKFVMAFVVGAVIPIILLQFISYRLNDQYMTRRLDEMSLTNLTQMSERANLTLESYTNLLYQIYIDDDIATNINVLMEESASGKAMAYNQILNRLKQYDVTERGIRCIAIVCADGSCVTYDYKTGSFLENLWSNYGDMRKSAPYLNAVDQSGMVITPTEIFHEEEGDSYLFHISKRIFDLENLGKGTIATVIMSVDASVLSDICLTQYDEETGQKYGISFILSSDRDVITYPETMFMGIRLKPELTIPEFIRLGSQLKDKDVSINQYEDTRTGWTFYYAYDREYILQDIRRVRQKLFAWGAAAISFSAVMLLYIIRKILKSVSTLINGMDQVKAGQLNVALPVESRDEIGQITNNFNEMTKEFRFLIAQVEYATDQKKNAEIKALEAQINPHFLYNTLDSINWMAIEKGEYEISRMLRDLGVILRYSVNNSNQKVTLAEAADWLEKYVGLQQVRFNHSFEMNMQIQEAVKKKRIYKLLLQPFIENAILHGFDGMESGGKLNVDILEEKEEEGELKAGKRICIIIEDNGSGMTKEQTELYNDRKRAIEWDSRSIGLHNAFSRMDMYYGGAAEWNLASMKGMGTVVTLKIPVEGE